MPTDRKSPHAEATPLTKADRWIQAKRDRPGANLLNPGIPTLRHKGTVTGTSFPWIALWDVRASQMHWLA